MSENILEIKDLNVSYGGIKAVKDISFCVPNADRGKRSGKELNLTLYCGPGEAGERKRPV